MNRDTYDCAKFLKHTRLARLYAESLLKEKQMGFEIKNRLRAAVNRLNACEKDMLSGISPAGRQIMESQLLDADTSVQMEAITDMILALPQPARDTIEKYVEGVYKLNSGT